MVVLVSYNNNILVDPSLTLDARILPTPHPPHRKGDLADLDDVGAFAAAFLRK